MQRTRSAFTLVELLIAMLVFSMVSVGLFAFTSGSLRLVGRNLATNHSHEVMRVSDQELLYNLHASATAFSLITFNGTTYADATPTATTDQDPFTQQYISTRANGVRFRLLAGGPYKLTTSTISTTTSLTFDFGVGGTVAYVPQVGDKVVLPLLSREFDITAVTKTPTAGSTTGTVTITPVIGFTVDATTAGNVTTGYFYRSVAYTVYNNQLRYHANYTGAAKSSYRIIRDRITSPKPFGVLFVTTSSPSSTGLNLRMSLEFYDTNYSARQYIGGTVTLQAVVPPRVQPPDVTSTTSS
ncbi:MAG: prepilin-type N-terminal cleavage/methylation domain-containing protein [Chthoniobacter sp.]|uniref:prepilin-type N-terminal cleavage/methylation domain-containing protein n=1 Tax=Chthoniobacter sp. TaxID=2510640 RepID=UPI0032A6E2A1